MLNIMNGTFLSELAKNAGDDFRKIFPELIKRLINSGCPNLSYERIPIGQDVVTPGYDGVIDNKDETRFVCKGKSIWEIGTSHDSLKKINSDYEKRTNSSLGITKNDTVFYLVSPYIWSFNNQGVSINKWENDHKKEWKDVKVYDACIISDWINSEPGVCAWLLEKTNNVNNIDFCSLNKAWDMFSEQTNPKMKYSLFLETREEQTKSLIDFLSDKQKEYIIIKSETTKDSFGFCLASLLSNKGSDKFSPDNIIVINNYSAYKTLSSSVKGKTFLLNFKLSDSIIEGNTSITFLNKEDTIVTPDILLTQLTKGSFDKALKDMGVSNSQLYYKTHGSILSLIRAIPGTSTNRRPKWADYTDIIMLAPLILLRQYRLNDESDKKIISYLAKENYDTLEKTYYYWESKEDSPIKIVENTVILTSLEEAWMTLKMSASMSVFKRLINIINACFGFFDSSLATSGITQTSELLRHKHNLLNSLELFANHTDDQGAESAESVIIELIKKTADDPCCLINDLPSLASSAPKAIMNFLKNDYKAPTGIISNYFANITDYKYNNLLFALDEISNHIDTRVDTCNLLFQLCIKTKDSSFSTSASPEKILLGILCLWNSYSSFSLDEKKEMIERYFKTDPDYVELFIRKLLNLHTIPIRSNIYNFSYTQKNEKMITEKEYQEVVNSLGELAFVHCLNNKNTSRIVDNIDLFFYLSPSAIIKITSSFNSDNYCFEELISIHFKLRQILDIMEKNGSQAEVTTAIQAMLKKTTPNTRVGQNAWLFFDYFFLLPQFQNEKELEAKRREIFENTLLIKDLNEVLFFVHYSKDDFSWGAFYAELLPDEIFLVFSRKAKELNKLNILYGLIDKTSPENCKNFFNSLGEEEQLKLLPYLSRLDILEILDTAEKEKAFWKNRQMFDYDDTVFEKLLKYNPNKLLEYFAYRSNNTIQTDIDKIEVVLMAVIKTSESISKIPSNIYPIDEIFKRINEEQLYSVKIGELCSELYKKSLLDKFPEVLKKYYYLNPTKLIEDFLDPNNSKQFDYYYYCTLPDIAYIDESEFEVFFVTLFTHTPSVIPLLGCILGKSRVDSDGIFPHSFIRKALEKHRDNNLINEIIVGKINNRQFTFIDDGTNEQRKANQFKEQAKTLEIQYPETARILRGLAKHYEQESKKNRLYSETGLFE